jgi:hypothetical protein
MPNGIAFLAAVVVFGMLFVLAQMAGGHAGVFLLGLVAASGTWFWVRSLYLPQAERAYRAAMGHWQKQWCCMKCGHVFAQDGR